MSEMAGGLLASNSIFIRTLQMPNKMQTKSSWSQFQPIFHPSLKFTTLRSQQSVKYAVFFISSLLKF